MDSFEYLHKIKAPANTSGKGRIVYYSLVLVMTVICYITVVSYFSTTSYVATCTST
jgi:hypothetical protein